MAFSNRPSSLQNSQKSKTLTSPPFCVSTRKHIIPFSFSHRDMSTSSHTSRITFQSIAGSIFLVADDGPSCANSDSSISLGTQRIGFNCGRVSPWLEIGCDRQMFLLGAWWRSLCHFEKLPSRELTYPPKMAF